ncbi:aminotransferase class I/II-fold pyridoxal phosphate-dependent enzyme [Frigidibacter sp. ROC022]|uniref:aminotransferase class I/II-fold pyridoxal phosphate-dependent enzyme n=1 Tax=Frigidibacter sp. ROC022 TaxID=2971796 RepID=UPI00215ABF01|nr:pyridoxal phosphate-dependent aminotransferase family protein [Frigidibacter sp. ROC022]MCR8726742.1 pyridoxal phosphate-dependent aminotransferase family protein [Frigidibacter sp. ROC022]
MAYDPFSGALPDFFNNGTRDLLDRWSPLTKWMNERAKAGVDPYTRSTASRICPRIEARSRTGQVVRGVNFASQDYLSLASHPRVIDAASQAARDLGVHSAGSVALMGLTEKTLELELERRIAEFVATADAIVFPTGWGAGYGVIKTLIQPSDHVVIDVLAHACLQEGAANSTDNVHRFQHCSADGVEKKLRRIRRNDPDAGILVVTESVFSMDSDTPDIATLQGLADEYGATLLVDVAHDLGAMGPTGRGQLELQGMLGKVGLVMGSFSKTFASNGGFVACNHPALKLALRLSSGPSTFSNAISPMQAAVVLECLDIISGPEGETLRSQLAENITRVRRSMLNVGLDVLGTPSPIVPVILGDNRKSRLVTSRALSDGLLVNLVEFPAVARNACRWRLQVMAGHEAEDIDRLASITSEVVAWASAESRPLVTTSAADDFL